MKVRLANMNDLSAIVAFGKTAMVDTNYAPLEYNAVVARRTVKQAMCDRDSRVWVTEHDGQIKGLLIGRVDPMPMVCAMSATDVIFTAEQGGDLLLGAFIDWCKLRKVRRIDMGISAGMPRGQGFIQREPAIRQLFESAGFIYSGPMFHMNLEAP